MEKEKAKEIITQILKKSITKRKPFDIKADIQYPHAILPNNDLSIWAAISFFIKKYKLGVSLPHKEFVLIFPEFKRNFKKDPQKAADNFFSSLSSKPNHVNIPDIPKIQKGVKRTRRQDLRYYKEIVYYFDTVRADFMPLLLLYQISELLNEDFDSYVCMFYGIRKSNRDPKEPHEVTKGIIDVIENLKEILRFNMHFISQNQKWKKWFVDLFGNASERYLPDWKNYYKKSRKPNFREKFLIFKKFVNGATPEKLGYSGKYNVLRYEVVPQGLIYFLHMIHISLYNWYEEEAAFLKNKIDLIRETLKDVQDIIAIKILDKIKYSYLQTRQANLPKLAPSSNILQTRQVRLLDFLIPF
jgi:hypothetical protein